jgi:PAT family beta-lactamase induction signal transducer AmpG
MIDLTIHQRFRYILFTGLYLAEGLYQTMLILVTPLYLLEKNIPIPIITIVIGIGELPWALKFVWGGVIDFYHKYGRKKFTIFGTVLGGLGFLSLSLIDQYFSLLFFTIFLFIGHTGVGFLDAGADAWAIDITTKKDRGKINAFMNIGKSFSSAIGGPVLIIIALNFGYNISFIITGLVILILTIIPMTVEYSERKIKKLYIWQLLKKEFSKKTTQLTTLYFFIIVLNPSLLLTIIVIYAKTVLFWDDAFIGIISMILFFIGTLPGSIIGGVMADKIGRKKILYLFLFLILIFSISLIFISFLNIYMIILLIGLLTFSWGGHTAAIWATVMDIINPKIGASEHEVICSIANFGDSMISAAAGTLIVLIGFNNIFLLSAIIVIPAIIILSRTKIDKIVN